MAKKNRGFSKAVQDSYGNWWADEEDEDGNITGRVLVEPTGGGEDNEGNPVLPYRAIVSGGRGDDTQALDSRIKEKTMLGYDPSIAENFAVNMPAGLAGDSKNWHVGQQVSQGDLASVVAALNKPGAYEGINGMTQEQYLADPRASIRSDGAGNYTFQPDKMQGDFKSIDQESLLESLGAFPLVMGAFAAPFAASLGAAGALGGAAAPGAGTVGAGAGAGSLAGEFSLMAPGTGLGGASAGLGLNTAGIGLTPGLTAAGGGAGAMGAGTGLGLSLGTGGLIAETAAGLASAGGVTLPSLPALTAEGLAPYTAPSLPTTPSMPQPTQAPTMPEPTPPPNTPVGTQPPAPVTNLTNPGLLPGTTNVAQGVMNAGSLWDSLGSALGLTPTAMNSLKGIAGFGGSLLEYLQSKDIGKDLASALDRASATADPFGSQRGYYQDMLKQSYSDPNFFKNNAVFQGISSTAMSDAERSAAARGYNNSSNVLYDVADRVQKTGMNYATQFQGQLAQNAGAGISPGTAATIQAQGAQTVANANQQTNGAMGATLGQLPNLINGIKGLM